MPGCQCAFISEDPEDWEVERAQLSEATVLSSMLIHCDLVIQGTLCPKDELPRFQYTSLMVAAVVAASSFVPLNDGKRVGAMDQGNK